MDLPAAARARVLSSTYAGGHMFYLHDASLAALHARGRDFFAELRSGAARRRPAAISRCLGPAFPEIGPSIGPACRQPVSGDTPWPRAAPRRRSPRSCSARAPAAPAQEMRFFRIGTGGVAGTYYPIGGLIADIISSPPGARPCDKGGSCGVPGLVAIAQSSNGSVANVDAIKSGELESGFVQSDIAYWAYTGTGIYEGQGKVENLRAIANLYPGEHPHRRPQGRRHRDRCATSPASGSRSTSPARARWSTPASSSRRSACPRTTSRPQYIKPSPAVA